MDILYYWKSIDSDLKSGKIEHLKAEKGAAVSALAVSLDGSRVAWGDEDGGAGVVETGLA